MARRLTLGTSLRFDGTGPPRILGIPASNLRTHSAIVGSTGSGKTGMIFVMVEEALRIGVPTLLNSPTWLATPRWT